MKKVLVTMAVLCFVASMSQASILNIKLMAEAAQDVDFYEDGSLILLSCVKVHIYAKITTSYAGEILTNRGLADFAVTVYTPGTDGLLQPFAESALAPQKCLMSWNATNVSGQTIPAARQNFTDELPLPLDTDLDACQAAGSNLSSRLTVGTGSNYVWLATEYWQPTGAGGTVTLRAQTAPSSRHWTATGKEAFTGYGYFGDVVIDVPPAVPTSIPPVIAVNVNGVPVTDGDTLTILGHNMITVDTLGSTGDITGWSFINANGPVSLSDIDNWTGDSYNLYGGTLTYTAFGAPDSSLSFNVIPEPATLALLGLGAVATLLRRKK